MVQILLRSVAELREHVSNLGIFEPPDEWVCPVCHAQNFGIHHAFGTTCSECHNFTYPALRLPLKMYTKDYTFSYVVDDMIQEKEKIINTIRRDIENLEEDIENLEEEISDLEEDITKYQNEITTLQFWKEENSPNKS